MSFTPKESTPPETLPAGARWAPPGLPPAPPGGGTGGPPGGGPYHQGSGGAPGEPDLVTELLPLLNDLAVARTTFETLDCYSDDRELRSELMSIVEEARGHLLRQLDSLLERVAMAQPPFTDEALRGLQSSLLSAPPSFGTFSLTVMRSRESLHAIPPREFALLVLEHCKAAVQDDAHYHSGAVFDAEVHQDFMALLYAAQLVSLER